jgi:hypothetical protein
MSKAFVCYHCKDNEHEQCVGVPCLCECEFPIKQLNVEHEVRTLVEEFRDTWNRYLPSNIRGDDGAWFTAAHSHDLQKKIVALIEQVRNEPTPR